MAASELTVLCSFSNTTLEFKASQIYVVLVHTHPPQHNTTHLPWYGIKSHII